MSQENKTLGHKLGEVFAAVVVSCVSLVIIAATVRFCLLIIGG